MQKKPIPVLAEKSGAGHFHKRSQLQDVLVQWESMDNKEIVNLVLACNPWNKGAITYLTT